MKNAETTSNSTDQVPPRVPFEAPGPEVAGRSLVASDICSPYLVQLECLPVFAAIMSCDSRKPDPALSQSM